MFNDEKIFPVDCCFNFCIRMYQYAGQVDEKYLVEKTENESALIKQIERKIIEKNKREAGFRKKT